MAVAIAWPTKTITIPQADLTPVSAGLYELDTDTFRLALKSLEDNEQGITYLDTHRHNTEIELGGVTYARTVEIINGYTITFEDGEYAVRLVGSNNNIADVTNVNSVSVRSANSAGMVVAGSGVTSQDKTDIIAGVWAALTATNDDPDSMGELLQVVAKVLRNRQDIDRSASTLTVYDDDDTTPFLVADIYEDHAGSTPVDDASTRIDRRDRLA